MKWLDALRRRKGAKSAAVVTPDPVGIFGKRVVIIDNTTKDDNWIRNETDIPVTIACNEMFGAFNVDLLPKERKRIVSNVKAAPYRRGDDSYDYDDLRYSIARREEWAVRREDGELVMVKIRG